MSEETEEIVGTLLVTTKSHIVELSFKVHDSAPESNVPEKLALEANLLESIPLITAPYVPATSVELE